MFKLLKTTQRRFSTFNVRARLVEIQPFLNSLCGEQIDYGRNTYRFSALNQLDLDSPIVIGNRSSFCKNFGVRDPIKVKFFEGSNYTMSTENITDVFIPDFFGNRIFVTYKVNLKCIIDQFYSLGQLDRHSTVNIIKEYNKCKLVFDFNEELKSKLLKQLGSRFSR